MSRMAQPVIVPTPAGGDRPSGRRAAPRLVVRPAPPAREDADLFVRFTPTPPSGARRPLSWSVSIAAHALGFAALLPVPLLLPDAPPAASVDYIRVLIYDPPPPPPPPLPRGHALLTGRAPERVRPEPTPSTPSRLEAPIETPSAPADPGPDPPVVVEGSGSPTGSDRGVPEGMEEGVEGGVVGGIPGGVIGGVIGGTGTGPVPRPLPGDQPPRALKLTKPQYPQDAFVKKVEGTVIVEFLIDTDGRVSQARVVSSVPLLDAAALACVREWLFRPAVRQGRPIASIARAPVSFRIF
jgi:periplasmic protein TonB